MDIQANHVVWKSSAALYVLSANGNLRIGICTDWNAQLKKLRKEMKVEFQVIKTTDYEKYWQAELIEQVAKYRMQRWWFEEQPNWIQIPAQLAVTCINDCKKVLSPEYMKFSRIHKKPKSRKEHYRQIAEMYFSEG